LNPKSLGAKAERTHAAIRAVRRPREHAGDHRDTPPEDVELVAAGLLARGSSHPSDLPEACASVADMDGGSPLTVAGAAPACAPDSLLALAPLGRMRTVIQGLCCCQPIRQATHKEIFIFRPARSWMHAVWLNFRFPLSLRMVAGTERSLMRKLLKRSAKAPRVLITDKLIDMHLRCRIIQRRPC
jgi:hypothetical protein